MSNLAGKFLKMTPQACGIQLSETSYPSAEQFQHYVLELTGQEYISLLRHYYVANVPFVFRNNVLLPYQIEQYLEEELGLAQGSIKLIGSSKIGFSMNPYGRAFSAESDLDFSLISLDLIERLEQDFLSFKKAYHEKRIQPASKKEQKYWEKILDTFLTP